MIQIRTANEEDHTTIASFQVLMAQETENLQLEADKVSTGVLSVMRDPEKGKYYVAVSDGKIIASLLITYEWSDWRSKWVWWMQSVYVLPEMRRMGVFQQMYNHIKQWAEKESEVGGLRLYVDKSNIRAMEVYSRLGMDGDHYRVFEWMKS
ncbi:MAG: GNAT family N-acetyltransferase [Bacteroidales bacterium]|nr:GNAT family N-acetyltransferase [Bacteroidales bacterium]